MDRRTQELTHYAGASSFGARDRPLLALLERPTTDNGVQNPFWKRRRNDITANTLGTVLTIDAHRWLPV
jgi:hypothetical protein